METNQHEVNHILILSATAHLQIPVVSVTCAFYKYLFVTYALYLCMLQLFF